MVGNIPQPPAKNKTELKDVILKVEDLLKADYDPIHIMVSPGEHELDFIGTKDYDDIPYWANRFQVFSEESGPEDRLLLKGKVGSAKCLPYTLGYSDDIFIFYSGDLFHYTSSADAAKAIELTIKSHGADIDDFIVLIGMWMTGTITGRISGEVEKVAKEWENERFGTAGSSGQ